MRCALPDRPPHGRDEIPGGYEVVAVEDKDWRLVSGKRCRLASGHGKACGRPSVAELNRARRWRERSSNWWAYCERHLYGRWVEDGQVMHWILRKIGGEDA
jgi:hypothetical protein